MWRAGGASVGLFRPGIRRGIAAIDRVEPVEVFFDLVERHAQIQRGLDRFLPFEKRPCLFQQQLGNLVRQWIVHSAVKGVDTVCGASS